MFGAFGVVLTLFGLSGGRFGFDAAKATTRKSEQSPNTSERTTNPPPRPPPRPDKDRPPTYFRLRYRASGPEIVDLWGRPEKINRYKINP
jgi:hypothetical protein